MVKIITDSSCMMNKKEASVLDVEVLPLVVTINNQSYEDLEDMHADQFIELISLGHVPTSSQPSIGKVVEVMEKYDEIINITMADGLSGTYLSACSAKKQAHTKGEVVVYNSKTLCGTQKYLVEKASRLAKENKSLNEIIEILDKSVSECFSYLMPSDFNFLKRGGRMTPLAATMGGLLKIKPIVRQTADGKRLDKFHIARTYNSAIDKIIEELKDKKIDESFKIYVSHANAEEKCQIASAKIKAIFDKVELEIIKLSPAMITQGGPGCVAIQAIKK